MPLRGRDRGRRSEVVPRKALHGEARVGVLVGLVGDEGDRLHDTEARAVAVPADDALGFLEQGLRDLGGVAQDGGHRIVRVGHLCPTTRLRRWRSGSGSIRGCRSSLATARRRTLRALPTSWQVAGRRNLFKNVSVLERVRQR